MSKTKIKTKLITLAISGASGTPYSLRLLECLLRSGATVQLLISRAAREVFRLEMNMELPETDLVTYLLNKLNLESNFQDNIILYSDKQWTAPIASGSNPSDAMVVCPCSSSTLSAIAYGQSNNLLERAADVILKERRPLILVHRETPLSLIHINNMKTVTEAGAIILPASPGFYHQPKDINELVDFVVARVLDQLQIEHSIGPRWGL